MKPSFRLFVALGIFAAIAANGQQITGNIYGYTNGIEASGGGIVNVFTSGDIHAINGLTQFGQCVRFLGNHQVRCFACSAMSRKRAQSRALSSARPL